MPQTSASGQRAGSAVAVSGPASGPTPAARRRHLSTADRLDSLSMRLDDLVRDVRFTPQARSHREVDRRINEAEEIAAGLRAIFRSAAPPEHPPLKREGNGAWW